MVVCNSQSSACGVARSPYVSIAAFFVFADWKTKLVSRRKLCVKFWMIATSWSNRSAKSFATRFHGTNVSIRRDIVVAKVTALWAAQPMNRDLKEILCVFQSVQTGCRSHSASCSTGLRGTFSRCRKGYLLSPICLHGVHLVS